MPGQDRRLVIVGTGEIALLADQYYSYDSDYEVVAFAAERPHLPGDTFEGRPAVPLDELRERFPPDDHHAFVATSARQVNRLRARLFREVKRMGYTCASYVHSSASVWRNVRIGENCLIGEATVAQPFVTIGDDVFVYSGNVIGHRVVIEDHCLISGHVSIGGFCRIGARSFLGLNSTFNDRTGVAEDCIVASGSLVRVFLDEPGRIYHGVPARAAKGMRSHDVEL